MRKKARFLSVVKLTFTVNQRAHSATINISLDHPTIQAAREASANGNTILTKAGQQLVMQDCDFSNSSSNELDFTGYLSLYELTEENISMNENRNIGTHFERIVKEEV